MSKLSLLKQQTPITAQRAESAEWFCWSGPGLADLSWLVHGSVLA